MRELHAPFSPKHHSVGIQGRQFYFDDKPIRILSGAIHYFRIIPHYWKDRLLKLKACGFNTVETYVPWNLHEPKEGIYNFEGMADVLSFIKLAGELDLHVIVRPSPYICAEWEFGGLPAWLLKDQNMRLRCYHQPFLDKIDAYYDVLLPLFKPLLCTNGGPIIAMQVENEYGSYGNDTNYLTYLKEGMIRRGMDVLLFTSDGPEDFMLQGGMIPGVFETANFGSKPIESFQKLEEYQPDQPYMCMEFWNGWFDHWREPHHTRDASDVAQVLDMMLQTGASVNFYMFHGGTNFGFFNGANHSSKYEPTITSYDYDSLLDEAGRPTKKYFAVQEVLAKYTEVDFKLMPEARPVMSLGPVSLTKQVSLFDCLQQLSTPVQTACPEPMEVLGQDYGFILYTTDVSGPREETELVLQEVHDRALIFLDGEYKGVIERWNKDTSIKLTIPKEGAELSILVENMGRINYGPQLKDYKGITEGVRLERQFLFNWTIHSLPLDDLSKLTIDSDSVETKSPAFYKGTFKVEECADTFIELKGWTKGVVYVNGFNLGRYWEAGPQQTLYVPAPLLKEGENELIIFELHKTKDPTVLFLDEPKLG